MPDFRAFVREHLAALSLPAPREWKIVEELEESYDALIAPCARDDELPRAVYSARNAIIGSTRAARWAGTSVATSETTVTRIVTTPYVSGSRAVTPNRTF